MSQRNTLLSDMMRVDLWKHVTRLDEPETAAQLAKAFDFWGYGPIGFVKQHLPPSAAKSTLTTHNPTAYRTPVAAQYVIFSCVDGPRYLVSHSIARMCDSLADILDDLDLVGGQMDESPRAGAASHNSPSNEAENSPISATATATAATSVTVDEVLSECALLEVAIPAASLEAVLLYLTAAVERGTTSVIPYPLTGIASSLETVVQPWEMQFLEFYTPALLLPSNYPSAAAGNSSGSSSTGSEPVVCPPLISALRAADYLGINSLRDLTCAYLATKLLNMRDENKLAAMLGLQKLPSDAELEDVYSRFPFLVPNRFAQSK